MVLTTSPRAGCSYFGVRIVRHVRRDMADLAARGYSGVLHTFSENDFAYYRDTMREIVEASHDAGLTVQASPWGARAHLRRRGREPLGHVPPGGVPGARRRAARRRCLPQQRAPTVRSARSGPTGCSTAASTPSSGTSPRGWFPRTSASTIPSRWTCRCDALRGALRRPVPARAARRRCRRSARRRSSTSCARSSRTSLRAAAENTICLLPSTEGNARDLRLEPRRGAAGARRRSRPIRTGSTGTKPAGPFVRRFARLLRETCERHGVRRAALAAELRPHRGGDPRARGGDRRRRARKASTTCGRGATRRAGS